MECSGRASMRVAFASVVVGWCGLLSAGCHFRVDGLEVHPAEAGPTATMVPPSTPSATPPPVTVADGSVAATPTDAGTASDDMSLTQPAQSDASKYGVACSAAAPCAPGFFCVESLGAPVVGSRVTWPNGYCTTSCIGGCPKDTRCVWLSGLALCVARCGLQPTGTSDPCRTGYQCCNESCVPSAYGCS
jgi:hypothetical protein